MNRINEIPLSKYFGLKYELIGRLIAIGCHIIGWFTPFFFAGSLESGNVGEYFRMMPFGSWLSVVG